MNALSCATLRHARLALFTPRAGSTVLRFKDVGSVWGSGKKMIQFRGYTWVGQKVRWGDDVGPLGRAWYTLLGASDGFMCPPAGNKACWLLDLMRATDPCTTITCFSWGPRCVHVASLKNPERACTSLLQVKPWPSSGLRQAAFFRPQADNNT